MGIRYSDEMLKQAVQLQILSINAYRENEEQFAKFDMVVLEFLRELQEYRKICDSPEKLKLIDAFYLERCEEINRLKAELAEYMKLEQEGLLLRLPCKLGATVHLIKSDWKIAPRTADMMFLGILWEEYGKEWFLTKEEAEQALERMKEVQE